MVPFKGIERATKRRGKSIFWVYRGNLISLEDRIGEDEIDFYIIALEDPGLSGIIGLAGKSVEGLVIPGRSTRRKIVSHGPSRALPASMSNFFNDLYLPETEGCWAEQQPDKRGR